MRQTLVDDYLEEISTELPEELYGNLSDAIYETACEFDEEVAQLKAENAKLRTLIDLKQMCWKYVGWCSECPYNGLDDEHDDCNCTVREKVNSLARELGIDVDDGNET